MRSFVLVNMLLALTLDTAHAQIIQRPVRRDNPLAWTSLSVGFLQQQGFHDPVTNASWDFGSAAQWRATLEIPFGGASFGVAGTMARVPLIYSGSPTAPRSCLRCEAHANISQALASLRIGGGNFGLHQVIEIQAGYTFFHNFRSDAGEPLGSEKAIDDFTFSLGFGLGYAFNERAHFILSQDIAFLIHKRPEGAIENIPQQRVTRIGGRVALGTRR